MSQRPDVSVVICTYNRCELLPPALESMSAQDAGNVRYEVVVVDNNSTDQTRQVIESFIARGQSNMRYVFEGKQGLSHARNAGISNAKAPIIAFTDDDIRAERGWVAAIKRAFDEHPEVDFIGGKVLPRWEHEPPAWLSRSHWEGPLALVDRGDQPFYSNADHPVPFPGANSAFRREVFARVGMYAPNFQRVKDGIGSTEDSEFLIRVMRAGMQGLYVPDAVVTSDVPAERMTKEYMRRWATGNGKYCAMLRLYEIIGADGKLGDGTAENTLFGTPASLYRELIAAASRYLAARVLGREGEALNHENKVRHSISYIRKRYEITAAERKQSNLSEMMAFASALMRRKVTRRRA